MSKLPKVFLDTTVLIAAALSENENAPSRIVFTLGAIGRVDLRVSRGVLAEADGVLRQVAGDALAEIRIELAANLDRGNVGVAADPAETTVDECHMLTRYRPDARVLAAAIETDCDVLVSEDKQHLLNNPDIGPPNTKLVVMSVREALDWLQERILSDIRETRR